MPKETKPFMEDVGLERLKNIDRTYVTDYESLFNWTKPGSYGSYSYEEFLAMVDEIRHLRSIITFVADAIQDDRDIEDKSGTELFDAYQMIKKCNNEIKAEAEKRKQDELLIKQRYNLKT